MMRDYNGTKGRENWDEEKRKPIELSKKRRGSRRWEGKWDETNSKLREWDETTPEEGRANLGRDNSTWRRAGVRQEETQGNWVGAVKRGGGEGNTVPVRQKRNQGSRS